MDGEERQDEMEVTGAQRCSMEEKEEGKKTATVAYSEGSSALLLRLPAVSSWFVSLLSLSTFTSLFFTSTRLLLSSLPAPALPRSATPLPNDSDQW